MHSWPAPEVPSLPGQGGPIRVFDSAGRSSLTTAPGPTARLYVCGITPYDATHLGHAATYLAFDLLVRAWRDAGRDVHYVQNVTDIDDPLLERALATGEDWATLAERETRLFAEDMAFLRVLPPTAFIGAVEAIDEIAAMVLELRNRGATYDLDGDVYFAVEAAPRFGSVSGLDGATMRALFAERGGDPDRAGKKNPLDPLLWRAARPGEPFWDSPLGAGRPGWHVECAAIARNRLGMGIDVQGGGNDLAFPHHEDSAAHAEVASGQEPFARAYVHAGMVGLAGEKMSKSRGNLVFVSRLRADGVDPTVLRLALLAHHYRQDWEWTDDDLDSARQRRDQWRAALTAPRPAGDPVSLLDQVRRHLADDLDAPAALAAVDRWAEQTLAAVPSDRGGAGRDRELVRATLDGLLGVLP